MSNNTEIKMPQLSFRLLASLVGNPGWTKSPKNLWLVGKLDAEGKFELTEMDPKATQDEQKKWADTEKVLPLMGKEYDALKECINYYVSEGKLGSTKYVYHLLNAFGFEPS